MAIAAHVEQKQVPVYKMSLLRALLSGAVDDPLKTFSAGWKQYGDLYRFEVRNVPVTIVSHPAYAQEVLVTQRDVFQKMGHSPRGDVLALVLGRGLITNHDTDSWLAQRRMIAPMFHKRRLAVMSQKMEEAGQRMLERWATLPQQAEVDINHEMMLVTMDIVSQTMFGSDVLDRAGALGDSVNDALHFAFGRRGLFALPMSWPLPQNFRFKRAMRILDETVYDLIDQRRGHEHEYDDFLSMLMEARDEETGEGMSRLQLRDEVASFFGAGHETTSHGLTWTLYLLAQHPEAMAKLRNEVDGVLNGRPPTFDDLPNLPYARMVFEEAMRLYPPVPILPRYPVAETGIDGYGVPAGSITLLLIWNIHRHPEIWERPDHFIPERFAPEQVSERHRMAFMPFGGGQRMCIGSNFAMIEAQMLLAMMVQAFDFTLQPGYNPELDLAITLRPKQGMPMRLSLRK